MLDCFTLSFETLLMQSEAKSLVGKLGIFVLGLKLSD